MIATLGLGSVLSGGGSTPTSNTPAAWVDMVNQFQSQALSTRLGIPIIYGVDAVHGHGNVFGATVFPHNIGLGATRDTALVREIGEATAAEVRATGIPWNFSPGVCVARDERWGRTYESFGEDTCTGQPDGDDHPWPAGRVRAPIADDHVLATASTMRATATRNTTRRSPRPTSANRGSSSGRHRPGRHGGLP